MASLFLSNAKTKALYAGLAISASMLAAGQVQALALGRLNVVSTQQQPLALEVSLAETEGVIPAAIKPSIASAGEFSVAGLDYQLWYKDIAIQVVERQGQLLLSLTSPQPVTVEQLDLLVQVEYMGGRLLGQFDAEFAALGSNAVVTPKITAEAVAAVETEVAAVETAKVEPQEVEEAVVKAEVEAEQKQLEAIVETVSVRPEPAQPKTVTVQAGQTLWRIAAQNTPKGVNTWQALMAIYKTNTKAFKDQQITRIMAGAKLTIPVQEVMLQLTPAQAKSSYEQLIASYKIAKPAPQKAVTPASKPAPEPEPKTASDEQAKQAAKVAAQQEQQLEKLNTSIKQLQDQSSGMQQQLSQLEQERQLAEQQALELTKQNEALAAGLANQQNDLQTLSADKQALEKDLTALDQQVSATDLELKDKQQQLQSLESELLALQQQKVITENAQAAAQQQAAQEEQEAATGVALSKQLYPWLMGGLVVLLLGLLFSLLWRWLNGRPKQRELTSEPPISDPNPAVMLDPLADYDARPSTQSQALHEAAERMDKQEQAPDAAAQNEASFIEQLLQEQASAPKKPQEDTLHLSAEVEALLQQQRQANDHRHEPQGHVNAEDAVEEKLDLARSYKQMGHVQEAQKLLQEILHEGNLEQQTQATLLLSRMRQD